jgi:hypothetical protein
MLLKILVYNGLLTGMGYPTGKKTRTGTGMNSNPHVGMDFLAGRS